MSFYPPPPPPPGPAPQPLGWDPPQPWTINQSMPVKRFPTIANSIGWIGMYFGFQIAFTIVTLIVAAVADSALRDDITSGNTQRTQNALKGGSVPILAALVLAGLASLLVMGLQLRKEHRHQLIGVFTPNRWTWGATIAAGIGLSIATLIINGLYGQLVLKSRDSQAQTTAIVKGLAGPGAKVLGFLAIVVFGPIVEELLFRGYLQTALSKRMKPWLAIVVSSCTFAAIHLQPAAFPMLALIGGVFGFLYYRTGSLRVSMVLHILNNGLAYVALLATT
jgi:membrane protease YdiL (CAAX protease family)